MMADRLANVALAEVFGQQPEDARQKPAFGSAHIHGRHSRRGLRSWEPVHSAPCRLLDLDAGVLDHLAPALHLAAVVAAESLRRRGNQDETLVDAEPFEGVGLYCLRRRLV